VLTDVVCYDNWTVPIITTVMRLAQVPGALEGLARSRILQLVMERLFPLPQTVHRGHPPREWIEDWYSPLNAGGEDLAIWKRYVCSQSPTWTLDAVPTLRSWPKPALVVWAAQDVFLPVSWGAKLAREIPGAPDQPVLLPFAGHFWQADVPQTGALAIRDFLDSATRG
jgi:pimeloyl-ACP methyl ester carboxylesterase